MPLPCSALFQTAIQMPLKRGAKRFVLRTLVKSEVLLMSATMDVQSLAQLFPKTPPVLKIPGMLVRP